MKKDFWTIVNIGMILVHTDHLGSSMVVSDSSVVVENTTYSPFGEVLTGGETTKSINRKV